MSLTSEGMTNKKYWKYRVQFLFFLICKLFDTLSDMGNSNLRKVLEEVQVCRYYVPLQYCNDCDFALYV